MKFGCFYLLLDVAKFALLLGLLDDNSQAEN